MKLGDLGVTEDEWARLYRAGQVDGVPDDISPAVVMAEVRRIVSGQDAPYDAGPPFDQLSGLVAWLDRRGLLPG